jgi:hypothetical protein
MRVKRRILSLLMVCRRLRLRAPSHAATLLDRRNENDRRYEQLRPETIRFIEEVERVAAAPVTLISTRFDFRGIIDRRYW